MGALHRPPNVAALPDDTAMISPEYLGDGVYAQPVSESEGLILTTGTHIIPQSENRINLAPETVSALVKYIARLRRDIADNYDPTPWCSGCGAKEAKNCHCEPIAEND